MTKKIGLVTIFIGLLLLPASLSNQVNIVYIREGNIWANAFTEPFEILYILCENGDLYGFDTRDLHMVGFSLSEICEYLLARGHEVSDVIQVIHNHFGYPFMSQENKRFEAALRRRGFTGIFSMIDTVSGKMVHRRNDGKVF